MQPYSTSLPPGSSRSAQQRHQYIPIPYLPILRTPPTDPGPWYPESCKHERLIPGTPTALQPSLLASPRLANRYLGCRNPPCLLATLLYARVPIPRLNLYHRARVSEYRARLNHLYPALPNLITARACVRAASGNKKIHIYCTYTYATTYLRQHKHKTSCCLTKLIQVPPPLDVMRW